MRPLIVIYALHKMYLLTVFHFIANKASVINSQISTGHACQTLVFLFTAVAK